MRYASVIQFCRARSGEAAWPQSPPEHVGEIRPHSWLTALQRTVSLQLRRRACAEPVEAGRPAPRAEAFQYGTGSRG